MDSFLPSKHAFGFKKLKNQKKKNLQMKPINSIQHVWKVKTERYHMNLSIIHTEPTIIHVNKMINKRKDEGDKGDRNTKKNETPNERCDSFIHPVMSKKKMTHNSNLHKFRITFDTLLALVHDLRVHLV
jgi:hypothetical protein